MLDLESGARGRLTAKAGVPRWSPLAAGVTSLGLAGPRDGIVFVPSGITHAQPAPLLVFFHGAGGDASQADLLLSQAQTHRVLVLAVESRGMTWDLIQNNLGPDVAFLDRALRWSFERFFVDPARLAVSGFSDGASYALSIGLANGHLFQNILAFSPGFVAPPELRGEPRVFVAHGTRDTVLSIEACSRRIVPRLEHQGYAVSYREFDGPHTLPAAVADEAFHWFLSGGGR